jgi:hypothetical protein
MPPFETAKRHLPVTIPVIQWISGECREMTFRRTYHTIEFSVSATDAGVDNEDSHIGSVLGSLCIIIRT